MCRGKSVVSELRTLSKPFLNTAVLNIAVLKRKSSVTVLYVTARNIAIRLAKPLETQFAVAAALNRMLVTKCVRVQTTLLYG